MTWRRSSSSCSSPIATTSSGGWAGREAGEVGRCGAAAGGRAAPGAPRAPRRRAHAPRLPGRAAGGAGAADDQAAARGRERPGGIDLKLEAELAGLSEEEAGSSARPSALDEVVRRLRDARPDHVLHRGREGDARVDAPPRADRARSRRLDPLRHRARVHPRDDLGRGPARGRLARRGGEARDAAAGGQDLRGAGRRRPEHPLQRSSGDDPPGSGDRSDSGTRSRGASRRRARRAGRGRRARWLPAQPLGRQVEVPVVACADVDVDGRRPRSASAWRGTSVG